MFHTGELSERKKRILRAIVDAYVSTGEPVGSKFLTENCGLECSSATIRNDMAELEMLGYLEQPHTSAGRIPSELGYRYYVDMLLTDYNVAAGEIKEISEQLREKRSELDNILTEASKIASAMTNYTAIAVKPRSRMVSIQKFEIMYLDSRSFVLVMLTSANTVKTRTVRLGFDILPSDAQVLAKVLNESLVNLTGDMINLPLIVAMEDKMGSEARLVSPIIKAVYKTMNELDGGDLKVEGVNRLLEYPEFTNVDKLRDLLEAIDEKEDILNIVSASPERDDISVYIGKESAVDTMSNSALVFKTVKKDGKVVGAIGVIGPCRMDYSKVIDAIDKITESVGNMLNDENMLPDGKDKREDTT